MAHWHTSKCHKLQTPKAESITVNNMFHHFRVIVREFPSYSQRFSCTWRLEEETPREQLKEDAAQGPNVCSLGRTNLGALFKR
jgi:hypothetical protein